MSEKGNQAVKTVSFMMLITLFGKILGMVREQLLAANYGTDMQAAAFLLASRIPRTFFDVIFASAISASFIPVFVEYLQKNGVWVYALEVGGDDIYKTDLKGNIAIVVGGEDTGVSRLTKEKCDVTMAIPMFGNVNSLNASVATGVAVYEAVRQRR